MSVLTEKAPTGANTDRARLVHWVKLTSPDVALCGYRCRGEFVDATSAGPDCCVVCEELHERGV